MTENKCNKSPITHNNSNKAQTKYLDHVYCSSETKGFRNGNNSNASTGGSGGGGGGTTGASSADLALLKENKQLRTMLILHLNLISEQDKQVSHLNDEVITLRDRNTQLEAQLEDLQKQQHLLHQRHLQRNAAVAVATGELLSSTPPPLAKIQAKPTEAPALTPTVTTLLIPRQVATANTLSTAAAKRLPGTNPTITATTNVIGECDGKLISKIVLHRVALPGRGARGAVRSSRGGRVRGSPTHSSSGASDETISQHDDEDDEEEEDLDDEEEEEDDEDEVELCEDDDDDDEEATSGGIIGMSGEEDSNQSAGLTKRQQTPPATNVAPLQVSCGTRSTTTPTGSVPTTSATTVPTPTSRGKQMPLMLWHAPAEASHSPTTTTDDSASCDSMGDGDHQPATSEASDDKKLVPPAPMQSSGPMREKRRCTYLSTPQLYATREWEDDESTYVSCDYEFTKADATALNADTPQLEIPKWTEHEEPVPLYSLEGTEDLSDDTFLKRHAKFETDERRRKKWDVQQIREQRRIERLKRRHCKDELLQQTAEKPALASFYPAAEGIQAVCFVQDLPVLAFGEAIPNMSIAGGGATASMDFVLPWHAAEGAAAASSVAPVAAGTPTAGTSGAQLNSSYVFLKKRRRQQSSSLQGMAGGAASTSNNAATARQRSMAAAAAAAATTKVSNDNP